MSKYSTLVKRVSSATTAFALSLASLTPAVMLGSRASAGQLTERQITMEFSTAGLDDNDYVLSFDPATNGDVLDAVVVDFCSNSPIIGAACTAPAGLDLTSTGNWTHDGTVYTATVVDTNGATAGGNNRVEFVNATGSDIDAGETVTITMNADNPDAVGTFYARVYTYAESTDKGLSATSIGTERDSGGIALSTTNDVSINARVQERLTFCAGTDADASATALCENLDGQIIDLGVLAASTINVSPVSTDVDGNLQEGKILLDTNAYYGAKVYYYSNNSLKTSGVANCEDNDGSVVNQCFNTTSTGALIGNGVEQFGMRLIEPTDHVDVPDENAMSASAPYNGANHAWITDESDEIASVGGVVAMDGLTLEFAATPSATTPSGYYTTSANFVAVASF